MQESFREDSRRFADDIGQKLDLADCILVPMPLREDHQDASFLSDDRLEELARQEHDRWWHAKLDDGWRLGPKKDVATKIHTDLKPWEELDNETRDKDRNAIRELPELLAIAGFRIQRNTGGASPPTLTTAPASAEAPASPKPIR